MTGIYTWGFPLFFLERHPCVLTLGPSTRISKLRVPSEVIAGDTLGVFLTGVQQETPLTLVLTGLKPLFPHPCQPNLDRKVAQSLSFQGLKPGSQCTLDPGMGEPPLHAQGASEAERAPGQAPCPSSPSASGP